MVLLGVIFVLAVGRDATVGRHLIGKARNGTVQGSLKLGFFHPDLLVIEIEKALKNQLSLTPHLCERRWGSLNMGLMSIFCLSGLFVL